MQKKQAKVFAGLLSMSLAVSLMTPLQGVSGQAARRKIALSKKSVTMTVGQKKTIRIKNAKGKRIKWSIKKKSIASYKKSGKYAVKLTAKKKGTTTLTCKVKNGKWKSYRCKVKVKKAALVRTPEATNDAAKITKKSEFYCGSYSVFCSNRNPEEWTGCNAGAGKNTDGKTDSNTNGKANGDPDGNTDGKANSNTNGKANSNTNSNTGR